MSWFMNLNGWQIWAFAFGIAALLTSPITIMAILRVRGRSKQRQQSPAQCLPLDKQCLRICICQKNPPCCSCLQVLLGHQCGFPTSEAGQEPKTTRTKQEQTDGQKDYQGKEQR